jgi:CO/xanthine dehydrogenase FAD-binding subunit
MKSPPFDYVQPSSLGEALEILAQKRGSAKVLGGGQSLVPMLALRLVSPELLVDINRLPELDFVVAADGGLRLGALVRWHRIEADPDIAAAHPMLAYAMRHVGHYQIRSRGTWAGSCAHADPSAEFAAIAVLSGASFLMRSNRGVRTVAADDFFLGPLTTILEPDELLCEATFPAWPANRAWAFDEFAIRAGDFAIAGAGVFVDRLADGRRHFRIVAFGSGDRAFRRTDAETFLNNSDRSEAAITTAAKIAADEVECQPDVHASAEYRRALTKTMVERTLWRAVAMAKETLQ